MEKKWNGMENNGENSGPLTSLPVDRLTATDCNAAARANCHLLTITVPRRPETLNSCLLAQVCFRYLYCTEVAMTGNIYLENYLYIL